MKEGNMPEGSSREFSHLEGVFGIFSIIHLLFNTELLEAMF